MGNKNNKKKAENEKNGVKVFCKEPGISNLDFAV